MGKIDTELATDITCHLMEKINARIHPNDAYIYVKRRVYKKQDELVREINAERVSVEQHNVYHVKTNDTLSEIAQRFDGASIGVMMRINNIVDPDVIYAGSTLFIYNKASKD